MQTIPASFAALAAPLNDTAPSGENLEYDPLYLELEAAVRGAPEVQYGDTVTPATPPDWPTARQLAMELFTRTHDLRVAMALTRASLGIEGVEGLAAGLALLEQLIAQHWSTVHPQLEADDDFDPMLRVNVLSALVAPSQLLREVREAPLVQVRALGSFSLRDMDLSRGDAEPVSDGVKLTAAVIDAAFAAADGEQLAATEGALRNALASIHAIELQLTAHVGVGKALDLSPLADLVTRAGAIVRAHLPADAVPLPADAAQQDVAPAPVAQRSAEIGSRADVVHMLDRLCAYYAEHEPASPVPLLLQRARRLVDKSFVELLQDLAPDALAQLTHASGVRHEAQ